MQAFLAKKNQPILTPRRKCMVEIAKTWTQYGSNMVPIIHIEMYSSGDMHDTSVKIPAISGI